MEAIEESECWPEPPEGDVDPGRGVPEEGAAAAAAAAATGTRTTVAQRVEERRRERAPFRTRLSQLPVFTTRRVHSDYVDAVAWLGDALVSKSTEGRVVVWKPDLRYARDGVCMLKTFALPDASIWFVRHALSDDLSRLACGATPYPRLAPSLHTHTHIDRCAAAQVTVRGRCMCGTPAGGTPRPPTCSSRLSASYQCATPPSTATMSALDSPPGRDGPCASAKRPVPSPAPTCLPHTLVCSILLAVSDDGCIWRWDFVRPAGAGSSASPAEGSEAGDASESVAGPAGSGDKAGSGPG